MIKDHESVDVFLGLDVGKGEHHAVALDRAGKKLLRQGAAQRRGQAARHHRRARAKHGPLLLVVDQPATIGALPVAVAQAAGVTVGYLPGLAMRRIADLHPGEAKTDARDASIIAEAARTMPHTLRSIQLADEQLAELTMLCGFDDDLAKQVTATSNRIRGLLTQIHPALERVLGPRLDHPAVLDLLRTWPTPAALRCTPAGSRITEPAAKRRAPRWVNASPTRSSPPSASRPSPWSAPTPPAIVLPQLAAMLADLRDVPRHQSMPRSKNSWRPTLFTRS